MGDLEHLPEAPCQALRRPQDVGLQSRGVPAFQDVSRVRPSDAGALDAWDGEPHRGPLQDLKRDGSHTALHRVRPILADEGVQRLACRAAFRPVSGPRLPVPCKSVEVQSAA